MHKGTIIAISWPETLVVKEGKWYDAPMIFMGFIKDNYYKVGHAAMLLIDNETGNVEYFDFGRYHTPLKMGRVRSVKTDPDLVFTTRAQFDESDNILNLESILLEIDSMPTSHGDGKTLASVLKDVDYDKAFNKINTMQSEGAIDYGPFALKGTNCSRFVAQVSRHSTTNLMVKLLLKVPYTITPSPLSNIRVIKNTFGHYVVQDGVVYQKPSTIYRKRIPALNYVRKN